MHTRRRNQRKELAKLTYFYSVWRPLIGPSDDWPLALCDYTTVDTEEDIRVSDAIRRTTVDEVSLLHYNEAHRWYCLKDQGVNDLLVFRNSNSRGERARKSPKAITTGHSLPSTHPVLSCKLNLLPGGFHAAVFNPESKRQPRESVEVRLVAFY